ncbi:hypothetical protein BJF93_11220 [Xaviernesmea oryzae]|uniref:Class I SAM-dependent methyltransferase n=1 Tax=Xaviernesmea oryzae TaxID=464029 RepID=A0A1Q9AW20_9HYPH|nr:class I SAM-dependent methyltransferase [Xaviernesmea oryzae]OLP59639.1 hypothetical protein BJF93_11220 [Xaviernesmea oryzae]SEM24294.1 hypothetical protein SAMN04487976_12434 [Xaviernesmea oryzae]
MSDNPSIERWKRAPRLNAFAAFFEEAASGRTGRPDLGEVMPDINMLGADIECLTFLDSQSRLWVPFDSHYFASIPFRLEEEARLGTAILAYCEHVWAHEKRPALFYTLGAGPGRLARTLARIGDGRIRSLNCSPTSANRLSFEANRGSEHAHFFLGPFFMLDEARYATDESLRSFRGGFDILMEDTTFQMYGTDREAQLAFIAPRIRADGLLIQVQKMAHRDRLVYDCRERQKDDQFKSRYFSRGQIDAKKREILETMRSCEVDLETSISALASFFRFSAVTWNSGNFYTILSSHSIDALSGLLQFMFQPAIPESFCYEKLPRLWMNGAEISVPEKWSWRQPKPCIFASQSSSFAHHG